MPREVVKSICLEDFRNRESRAINFRKSKRKKTGPEEDDLQAAIVEVFEALQRGGYDFEFAGDMNAGKRGLAAQQKAKRTGIKSGEPDIRIYLPGGKLVLIELKVKGKGSVSKAQRDRHIALRALGFDVLVWRFKTRAEAADAAITFIKEHTVKKCGISSHPQK